MEQSVRSDSTRMPECQGEDRTAQRDAGIARLLSGPTPTPRAANAGGSGTGDGPDGLLFALIEAHRTARDRLNEVVIWEAEDAPENAETKAVYDAASDAERKAFQALFEAQPATLVGLQAMLRYLAETPALDDEAEDFRRVMKAVASASEGIRAGAVRWAPDLVLSAPGTALPAPGSEEAKAAFQAACADADRLMQADRDGYPALKHPDGLTTWTKHGLSHALDVGEVSPADYARLYRLAAERELRMDAAALASDICALHALAYADEYPSLAEGGGNSGGTGDVAGQHVDWHNPPPGFMASPAIEPFGFLRIFEGIETELRRLHGIASAEYERRTQGLRDRLSEEARLREERLIRERLHLPALTAAVDVHSDGALALAALERQGVGHGQDPVFALIAEHKRAWTEYRRVLDIWNETPGGPGFADAQAAVDEPRRLEREAFRALLGGRPVTSTGALALADYLPEAIRPRDFEPDETDDGEGIRSLAEALRTIATILDPKVMAQGPAAPHDLSGCDLRQLACLHESLMTIVDHVSVTVEALAFWESRASQKLNPAGLVIEAQHDRLSRLLTAVEREAKTRQPTNDEEQQDRLTLLIRHELLCEGKIADKALLAEAVAAWGDR